MASPETEAGNNHVKVAIEAFRRRLKVDSRHIGEVTRREMIAYFEALAREIGVETHAKFSPTTGMITPRTIP